jgi:hypothetical protein
MADNTNKNRDRLPRVAPEDEALERELEGRQPADAQEAFRSVDQVDDLGTLSTSDIYEGEIEAGVDDDLPSDQESLELLTELELRGDETDDAFEAVEEGETYIPPIDPPTVPSADGDYQNAEIAAGFGHSARESTYGEDDPASALPADDDFSQRVRDALRADSATTAYASRVRILTRGRTVILRGLVDDLDDSDNLVEVASAVNGVEEVIDELDVRTMGLDKE